MLAIHDVCCVFMSHIRAKEDDGEYQAQAPHNNIGNCEEVVLTSKGVGCREYK